MASRSGQVVVKQGSLGHPWLIRLDELDPSDSTRRRRRPLDLTLLDSATLSYRLSPAPSSAPAKGGLCTIRTPRTAGELQFQPGTEDVDTVGEFYGIVSLTWLPSAGVSSPEYVPNRGYLGIVVEAV
jgi:hypothetical protein